MSGEKISALPPAVSISYSSDLMEIAHYVGTAGYVSQKVTPAQILSIVLGLMTDAAVLVGHFTLNASATSTVVANPICTGGSFVGWTPSTPDASAVNPMVSCVPGTGSFTMTHPNNPMKDQTFNYIVVTV
jgi:hypothetical protein